MKITAGVPKRASVGCAVLLGIALLPACQKPAPELADGIEVATAGDTLGLQGSERMGIYPNQFDPAHIRPGDVFLGLEIVTVEVHPSLVDSSYTGSVGFRGLVTLSGTLRPHPEFPSVPDARIPCFYADSTSASKLPRFPGDERIPWFCFTNPEETERMIGDIEQHRPATIIIDEFQTVRQFSDVYDTARLVRIETISDSTTVR